MESLILCHLTINPLHLYILPPLCLSYLLMVLLCHKQTYIDSIFMSQISISNLYYLPNLTFSLVSISQLCDFGYLILYSCTSCYPKDLQFKKVIRTGRR
ncbi:hypothetical protein JHK86_001457 [Glycine max]|nr:hypothetical protein JHK86_001457 [Glycine max]